MSNLKEILQEEYEQTESLKITPNILIEMIEEMMNKKALVEQEQPSMEKDVEKDEQGYFLPTIKITEAWGSPGTKDRQLIEQFTSRIPGNTLEQKLAGINRVIEEIGRSNGQSKSTPKENRALSNKIRPEGPHRTRRFP